MPSQPPLPLPRRTPVFPLPGLTLFPHTHLPLQVFEPRYRNLMEDTLRKPEAEHLFAIGTIMEAPGAPTLGEPPVFEVAGVGRIAEYSRLPDGRFTLVLEGMGRARLRVEDELVNGYRVFEADWLPDREPAWDDEWREQLELELRGLALALLREHAEKFRELLLRQRTLGALADVVSGYLPFPADFKLAQMADANAMTRAGRAVAMLERMMQAAPHRPLDPDGNAPRN
ncbi:MAG: LON peptidase substrate-binding domain-containing protein [Planctomycetes bacterium]|nr:LON peptidase substrate-binding domain-containing protein [Planctomycetota bacterium]